MIEFNATILVAMFSFVVFMFIMNAIFYRPILEIIRKREEYISGNYDEAKQLSDKAQHLTDEYNQKLDTAREKFKKQAEEKNEKIQNKEQAKILKAKEASKAEIQSKKDVLEKDKQDIRNEIDKNFIKNLVSDIEFKITGIR